MGAFRRVIGKDSRGRKIYSPTWYIRYTDLNGKQVWKAVPDAKSKRDAEQKLAEKRAEIAEAKRSGFVKASRPGMTFGELIDAFLDYSKEHKRSYAADVVNARPLLSFFGKDRKAQSITREHMEKFITWRQGQRKQHGGGELRPASINRSLALLKTAFARAVANGWIERTPCTGIKMLKENNVRSRILTDDEYSRLLFAAADHLKPIIRLAWGTGMRRGEIIGLTWDRVDLKGGWIQLRPEDTKTNEGRTIPLSPELIDMLREMKENQVGQVADLQSGDLVFKRWDGKAWRKAGNPKNAFNKACQRAGIKDFHFHDLRHCFVTRSRRAGYQDRRIMSITGHKTMSVFTRYDTVDREAEEKELREIVKHSSCSKMVAVNEIETPPFPQLAENIAISRRSSVVEQLIRNPDPCKTETPQKDGENEKK